MEEMIIIKLRKGITMMEISTSEAAQQQAAAPKGWAEVQFVGGADEGFPLEEGHFQLKMEKDEYLVVPKTLDFAGQEAHIPTYAKFDAAMEVHSKDTAPEFLEMLSRYRNLFPDSLPPELPPRQCIDHTIPTIPGVLPPKGGI